MMFEIEVSEQAQSDLRSIFEYIAFNLQAPENAVNQLDRLEKNIMKLRHLPERFAQYTKEPWCSRGLRIMPVDNYAVLYIPDIQKQQITIIRVMYGGRDIDKALQDIINGKK